MRYRLKIGAMLEEKWVYAQCSPCIEGFFHEHFPSLKCSWCIALSANCSLCVTNIKLAPLSLQHAKSRSAISFALCESKFPVGSSAKINLGENANARAIATRCCSPPLSWEGLWVDLCASPTFSSHCLAMSVAALLPLSLSGRATLVSASSSGSRWNCWKIKPISERSSFMEWVLVSLQPTTLPLVGVSSPEASINKLDFPDPDGPVMAYDSPCRMQRLTFSNRTMFRDSARNACETSRSSIHELLCFDIISTPINFDVRVNG